MSIVLAVLPVGRDNARTIEEIAALCRMSRRECEEALQAIADAGEAPLVATGRGVYLAETPDELEDYAKRLQGRIARQYLRVRGVRRAARAMRRGPEQIALWEVA